MPGHLPEPILCLDRPLWFLWMQDAQGTLKKQDYYSSVLEVTWHAWGPTARSQVAREGGRECKPALLQFCFYRSWRGVPRFTLYWWIQSIRAAIKVWEGKSRVTQVLCIRVTQDFLKRKPPAGEGWPSSLSGCVVGNIFIRDGCFWRGCLSNQNWNIRHLPYKPQS